MRGLYFKILPKGTCSIAGCLVGFPALDARPHGLGHSVQRATHCFEELGVALPRLELAQRSDYHSAMSVHAAINGERWSAPGETTGALSGDHCRLLRAKVSEVDAERAEAAPVAEAVAEGARSAEKRLQSELAAGRSAG